MFIWIGVVLCLTQSAMMSGLNLAFFSLSRLRLEAEAGVGSQAAVTILAMRRDSNFLLSTILWGNVGINVLLTLLSNSVLAGVGAFAFSTVVITFAGEILPQAFFSRRAMKMAALFAPVLRVYQFALYPVAKPSAWILDKWLGVERVEFFRERQFRGVIEQHIDSESGEIDFIEGRGALNFLDIDEVPISDEGEFLDPASVIPLPTADGLPVLPQIGGSADDPFIRRVNASGRKWVVLVDAGGCPQWVMDSDAYLRAALIHSGEKDGHAFCHRPVIIDDPDRPLGSVILDLRRGMKATSDEAIARDIVLLWTEPLKKVVTGADLLGRLLRGMS